jgi:hypothetical protein
MPLTDLNRMLMIQQQQQLKQLHLMQQLQSRR